jgi:Na+/alanine symporter
VTFAGPFLNLNFVWSLSDLIIAMILIFHLLPLLGITISNRKTMMADLNDYSQIQDNPAASGETTY